MAALKFDRKSCDKSFSRLYMIRTVKDKFFSSEDTYSSRHNRQTDGLDYYSIDAYLLNEFLPKIGDICLKSRFFLKVSEDGRTNIRAFRTI